jgi:hypothetical protein
MVEDAEELVEAIKGGDYDGNLVKIIEAVRMRFEYGTVAQRWKIIYDGETYTEDDLTLNEASTVERLTGTNWGLLNPVSSAQECQAIIAACLHHRQGVKLSDASKQAGQMSAKDAVAAITSYEVEAAPKDLSPSATTSSGS